jgi:hypothetical protein
MNWSPLMSTHPVALSPPQTLAGMLERIAAMDGLPRQGWLDLMYAVRRLAVLFDDPLSAIRADPAGLTRCTSWRSRMAGVVSGNAMVFPSSVARPISTSRSARRTSASFTCRPKPSSRTGVRLWATSSRSSQVVPSPSIRPSRASVESVRMPKSLGDWGHHRPSCFAVNAISTA